MSGATMRATWLLGRVWRRGEVVISVDPTEVTQSVCSGSEERLLGRIFPFRSPALVLIICQNMVQSRVSVILLCRKFRVVPFTVAVPWRTASGAAQNCAKFQRLDWMAGLFGGFDSGISFGHIHGADTRRCNPLPPARTAAHVRLTRLPLKPTGGSRDSLPSPDSLQPTKSSQSWKLTEKELELTWQSFQENPPQQDSSLPKTKVLHRFLNWYPAGFHPNAAFFICRCDVEIMSEKVQIACLQSRLDLKTHSKHGERKTFHY